MTEREKTVERAVGVERRVMWRADMAAWMPRKTEVPAGQTSRALHPPVLDSDGQEVWENTHFETEEEAWEHLERNAAAWVSLAERERERLREAEAENDNDLYHAHRTLDEVRRLRAT